MACYRPWNFKNPHGRYISLPCGRCIGCRQVRQRDWATRICHEAQMHKDKCFITLTYNNQHYTPTLKHEHFQQFIRALRKKTKTKIRYFMSGEYGKNKERPHYHAILFGISFTDLYRVSNNQLASKTLESLWTRGYNTVGDVNRQTAMYVAKYATKTITGPKADDYYKRLDTTTGEIIDVEPEYARMSLKPGIGATWHDKYWREVHLARDGIQLPGGKLQPAPRFYNERLKTRQPALALKRKNQRIARAHLFAKDSTPARLAVREQVAKARQRTKQRKL